MKMLTFVQRTFLLATCWILVGITAQNHLCPTELSNSTVTSSCSRQPGTVYNFTCNSGYTLAAGVKSVTCGNDGNWTFTSAVCVETKVICPSNFTGGGWDNCQNRENETCTYSCFSGFHKDPWIQNATCGSDGAWNRNTEKLCRRKCEIGFPNGFLNSSCTLEIGEACVFECELRYKVASGANTVTCQENGAWAPERPCEEVLCPTTIPNGAVSSTACDRRIYSKCPFICNQGFDQNLEDDTVSCDINGNWIEFSEPSCLERKGLCVNFFKHGRWADDCQFHADESCAFKCDGGFDNNPNITRNITCLSSAEWNIDLSLLCKENDHGLIVTLIPEFKTEHIYTVPTAPDGTPNLNYIRSHSFPTDAQFISVDGDYTLQHAYVYDLYTKAIYKDSNFSIGLSGDNKWTTLHRGLSKDYVKLAVDWISHNIYWTDPQYKWIMVQSLLGNDTSMYRALIYDNLEGPHALALDPMEALLFWSDIGTFTKIEVSSLSGRNRKSLISSNLKYPYSMAADYVARRLYLIDAGRDSVETVTYEGRDRKVLYRKTFSYFFDIAVYKDYLYVTEVYNDELYFFNKTNGKELHESLSREDDSYFAVTVFHPDTQPTSATAHCVNYGCEQICVTEKDGATCLCKDGYILNQDMKTCSLNNAYFHRGLMFSNKSSICIVDIRVVTHFAFDPKCILKTNGTKYMILDTDQRQIIIANVTAIYWARVDNPELHRLTAPSGIISGLAWDGYDRNVYWTEEDTGIIWRLSRESETAQVFLAGLNKPRDILILPHERMVYWISDRNGSTIESSNMDGSNHQIVLDDEDLVNPKSLCYAPYEKKIYFLDTSPKDFNYVNSCKLDGSDLHHLLSTDDKSLEELEIYRGHLLVTAKDANGTLIMSYSTDLWRKSTSGVFPDTQNISAIKVFDENFRQNETGPCFHLNGECEQICISNGKSRICECTFGFKLARNGKTCTSDPIKDNFMLAIDTTHNHIYQISMIDQSIQGINAKGTNSLSGIAYSPVHDLVIWGTLESALSIIHRNGTGEKILPVSNSDDGHVFPIRFAVDYSTGNIYFTAVNYMQYFSRQEGYILVLSPNGEHRVLVTGLSDPHGLVVYPSKGRMFYTDSGFNSHLGQANMDGSQSAVLLNIDDDWPTELTVDYKNDYLYWINYWDDSIKSCKLDGTDHNKLTRYPNTILHGLFFYQDYLFISIRGHSHTIKVNISNPNETIEFAGHGELGTIESISIYSSTVQNKNEFCSVGNGGCSTFCFPSSGGGICGCEDGVRLMDGSDKVCSNKAKCSATIPNGFLPINCKLEFGTTCSYYCDDHFSKNPNISSIRCNENGQWNADLNLLCTKTQVICPNNVPGGVWDNCQNRENETCTYNCYSGFHKDPRIQNATCGSDGAWNRNTEKLCRRKCELGIPNGFINSSCTLKFGEACALECELGFKVASDANTVTCQENGVWAPEEPCEEVLCPTTIPNGTVNAVACSRRIYSECPFICNQGFDPNPEDNMVSCDIDGNWLQFAKPSCLERKGLCINFFEHGKWAEDCQFHADETCAFECDGGFDKNPSIARNITCLSSAEWNIDLSSLCKENDRGLIVTLIPGFNNTVHVHTVPTALNGSPSLDYVRSLRFPIDFLLLSVDGDYTLQHAYVYELYTKAIYKDSNFSIGLSGDNKWTTLHRGLSKDYVKLAVDWISHNIYWTDPQYKWIMVQSLLGNDTSMYRVLIHDNLEGPHALALDPMEALLFWSDIGTFTKIEVSSLSGRNRKSLISSNLVHPYSLAADYVDRRLYLLDAGRDTVETVTYEGIDRKILFRKTYSSFFDIAVYKDYLYVTDLYKDGLYFFNKTNGKELNKSLSRVGETYLGVTVFHPDAQPTSATAHCVNYGCEHICVTEKDGASCLCKDGYTLNQDTKTCSLNNEYFHRGLMFSNNSSICIVDIRVVTHFSFDPKCVLKTNGTKYMILDTDQRQIILANVTAIYWARIDNPELHRLTELSGIISGLAWDGYDRNAYWTEENTGIIWRLSRESGTAHVFLEGLNQPRDILILPHERLVYWISDRNGSTIESSNMDGSNHQIVLDSEDLVNPRSLSYDPYEKRIYFLDTSHKARNHVISCKLDGSNLYYFLSTEKILEKLEIYRGHLLVTAKDANGTLIISYSLNLKTRTTSGMFSGTGNISAIKIFDENFRQNETGPCFNLNGECEQICISNGKSRICECTFGFKLARNGKSCTSDPIKDNFMLVGDSTHNDIYQISLIDQSVHGINAKGTDSLTGVIYSPVHDLVIWGADDESQLSIMHLNGTGKKMLPVSISDDSYILPIRFAVDYSTGNIYYTAVNSMQYFTRYESYIGVLSPKGKRRVLVTGLSDPHGLVVYPSKGLLFYTVRGFSSHLGQANMDGSQSAVLLNMGYDRPTELTVDYNSDYLYWISYRDDSIKYCKLDGTDHNKLTQYPGTILRGLAFYQDYLFITTGGHSHIIKVKITNPNETIEFAAHGELGIIKFISIYSSTVQNKNAFCSVNNGGCSTFCFPTPGGGICGCEDGVDLMEGSDKLCSNIPHCPQILNQIIASNDCQRVNGSKCTFTCKQGYKARPGVDKVLCNGEMYTPADPCEENKCPATLANGKWVNCNFSTEKTCNFTCNYGYTRNDAVSEVECQINGNWKSVDTDNLCKRITCPKQFNQGRIASTCQSMVGQRCEYECTGYGYKKNNNISRIECMESGRWNTDTENLCQQITCPKEIPNGVLIKGSNGQMCSSAVGTRCDFECNSGFAKEPTVHSLHCLLEGWAEDLQTLCTVSHCPEILNQIIVSTDCQRVNGSKCTFTCKQGYKARPGVDKVLCNGETYTPADPCEENKCPATLANGKWVNCNFSTEKTCNYTCNYGYKRNNAVSEVECQINGNWKLVDTDNLCIRITCPKQFNQGRIASMCQSMVGQRCEYECTGYGYKKNNNTSRIECMETGRWNRDTENLCQQITCPKEIPNGVLLKGSNGQMCSSAVGTRCDFECNSGFVKKNTVHSLHCLLEGWAEDLQTLCTVSHCPEILSQIIVSTDCQRVNGSKCTFTCKQGYKARPGVDKVLCNGETYTPADPCEENKCPATLANGKWVNCNFSTEKTCNFTCNYGYTRNDAVSEVECQINGNWKLVDTDNLCKRITCPKQFNQGRIASTCQSMVGQRCEYECTGYGYKKNNNISRIECMESGRWNTDTENLCQQITCPKEIPNGVLLKGSNGQICSAAIGTRCDFKCNSGFAKEPTVHSLHCLLEGWAEDLQTLCTVSHCPEILSQIIVSTDCQRVNGSKCTFTCKQGYKARPGVDKVLCNGETYTPADPCEENKCPATLANGKWVNCNFSTEKTCNYTCNYGYKRNNAVSEVECQINGNWKLVDTDNLCKRITCPKQFNQGRIASTCQSMVGQRCEYECTGYGYKKNNNISRIECMESGRWNTDTENLCQQITCPKEIPNGVLLKGSNGQMCSAAVGTRCDFECNSGFAKEPTVHSLHCLLEGWAEDLQTLCTVPHCPEILNQIIVSTDCQRVNGSKCTFTCKQGYKARPGVDKVLCNGEMYTPEDPCEAITCTKQFSQGRIVSTCESRIGQICEYECTGYGYKKNENISRIQCRESGTWNKDTNDLCQQITCPKEIPNGVLLQGSNGQMCSAVVGTQCDFECNSGFAKEPTIHSLHCLLEGWAEDLQTLCTVPPTVSSAHHSEFHPGAIGAGVAIGVSIVIVIILVIVRRKSLCSNFAAKRMEQEVMSGPDMLMTTSFGSEVDRGYVQVTYDNAPADITGPNKRDEPTELSLSPKQTYRGNTTKYDRTMAIPRPRAKENPYNKMP